MLGRKLRFIHRSTKWWEDCDTVNSLFNERVNLLD
jgi:hypothetical protein